MGTRWHVIALVLLLLKTVTLAQSVVKPAAGQSLSVAQLSASPDQLLNTRPVDWNSVPVKRVSLNRTPALYDTDEPAALAISSVDVRVARANGKLLVQLTWQDTTHDTTTLTPTPDTPPETRFRKMPTEADDRFFDAAAVMFPDKAAITAIAPSLQMGDAEHPVDIYYWNAARGAMVMRAEGRSTTRRTGQSFSANGSYQQGSWTVTMELPDLPNDTTVAFAIWNGSQKDRDGRKYFSVWQVLK
jgi:hypothetical protein